MKRLYELINVIWKFAKSLYDNPPTTKDDWDKVVKTVNSLITEHKDADERELVKNFIIAIMRYYEVTEFRRLHEEK